LEAQYPTDGPTKDHQSCQESSKDSIATASLHLELMASSLLPAMILIIKAKFKLQAADLA